jgi:hypothetical protein
MATWAGKGTSVAAIPIDTAMQAMRLAAWSNFIDFMFVPPFFLPLLVFKLPITFLAGN